MMFQWFPMGSIPKANNSRPRCSSAAPTQTSWRPWRNSVAVRKKSRHLRRFPMGIPPIAGWFSVENPKKEWMINGVPPWLRKPRYGAVIPNLFQSSIQVRFKITQIDPNRTFADPWCSTGQNNLSKFVDSYSKTVAAQMNKDKQKMP